VYFDLSGGGFVEAVLLTGSAKAAVFAKRTTTTNTFVALPDFPIIDLTLRG
jgi:hypothetical protein